MKLFDELRKQMKTGRAPPMAPTTFAKTLRQRVEKHAEFEKFLRLKAKEYDSLRKERVALRGGVESDDEDAYTLVEEEEREQLELVEEVQDDGEEIEIGDD